MSRTALPGSVDPRASVVHVLGDLTLYRVSATTTVESVTARDALLIRRHPTVGRCPTLPPLSDWFDEMDLGVGTRCPTPTGLVQLYRALDACVPEANRPVVEAVLRDLEADGLARSTRKGRWSLTSDGVREALAVRHEFTDQNVTAAWLDRTVDAAYYDKLVTHMTYRCPRSVQFNEVQELVHGYFANLIRRDGLRGRIASGNHPSPSDLRNWAYKSALSQWRDEGRDALTRGFKGCLTEKDLHAPESEDIAGRSLPAETQGVFLADDDEGHGSALVSSGNLSFPLLDVVGGNLEDEVIHGMTFHRALAIAESIIRRKKSGASDRFARIFRLKFEEDADPGVISKEEGVSRNRATALLADLRAAMQWAVAASALAAKILVYVRDNPYSRVEDMEQPVAYIKDADGKFVLDRRGNKVEDEDATDGGIGEDIDPSILDALVGSGKLRRVGGESYIITPAGEAAIDNEEHFGIDLSLIEP